MIEAPITTTSMNYSKRLIPRFESHHSRFIDSVLRKSNGPQSRTQLMDNMNLRLRLGILLSERVQCQGEIENLLDEMIDSICFEHLLSNMDRE